MKSGTGKRERPEYRGIGLRAGAAGEAVAIVSILEAIGSFIQELESRHDDDPPLPEMLLNKRKEVYHEYPCSISIDGYGREDVSG